MTTREIIHRPGGEQWRRYGLADGFAITTNSWRTLAVENPDVLRRLARYRRQVAAAHAGQIAVQDARDDPDRTYITEGNDGVVYAVGNKLAVKEAKPWHSKPFFDYFVRMETLRGVVQEHLPHWVATPANYGLYVSDDQAEQYLLMERIGRGITIDDVRKPDHAAEFKQPELQRMLERMRPSDHAELDDRLHESHMKLVDALRGEDLNDRDYLKDWGAHNVIVERLSAPIADSRFKLSIIDQQ